MAASGLDVLQAMMEGRIAPSGIAQTMPMRLSAVAPGKVSMRVVPDERHLNPAGMVHGGFAATCLDGAAALALFSALDAATPYSTVDLSVKYLRPLAAHTEYLAHATLVERTRSLGICSAELRGTDGKLHALASATLMVKT